MTLPLDNPYGTPVSKEKAQAHQKSLEEALRDFRAPFEYHIDQPLAFDGPIVGVNVSQKNFNNATKLVIATLACGYYKTKNPIPLGTADWAKLVCAVTAATGHGYTKQCEYNLEETTGKVQAKTPDPFPLSRSYPTLFHHLSAMAEHLEMHTSTDIDLYKSWFTSIKDKFYVKASENAAIETAELCRQWKANEIDWCSTEMRAEILAAAKKKNHAFFHAAMAELGLQQMYKGLHNNTTAPMPSSATPSKTGKQTPLATPTPKEWRVNPPQLVKKVATPPTTPHRRPSRPSTPMTSHSSQSTDPSPMPWPKKTPAWALVALGQPTDQAPPTATYNQLDDPTLSQAIQLALAPLLMRLESRLESLEQTSMPPPHFPHH